MTKPNQLDPADKLQGGNNILNWLTLMTCLLTAIDLQAHWEPTRAPLVFDPNDAGYKQACAIVNLNIGNACIRSYIARTFRGRPLHEAVDYLVNTYAPSSHELLQQLNSLIFEEDEPVTEFIGRAQSILTAMQFIADAANTTPLIEERAFLSMLLAKLPASFNDAIADIENWPRTHQNADCPLSTASQLLQCSQRIQTCNTPTAAGSSRRTTTSKRPRAANDDEAGPSTRREADWF